MTMHLEPAPELRLAQHEASAIAYESGSCQRQHTRPSVSQIYSEAPSPSDTRHDWQHSTSRSTTPSGDGDGDDAPEDTLTFALTLAPLHAGQPLNGRPMPMTAMGLGGFGARVAGGSALLWHGAEEEEEEEADIDYFLAAPRSDPSKQSAEQAARTRPSTSLPEPTCTPAATRTTGGQRPRAPLTRRSEGAREKDRSSKKLASLKKILGSSNSAGSSSSARHKCAAQPDPSPKPAIGGRPHPAACMAGAASAAGLYHALPSSSPSPSPTPYSVGATSPAPSSSIHLRLASGLESELYPPSTAAAAWAPTLASYSAYGYRDSYPCGHGPGRPGFDRDRERERERKRARERSGSGSIGATTITTMTTTMTTSSSLSGSSSSVRSPLTPASTNRGGGRGGDSERGTTPLSEIDGFVFQLGGPRAGAGGPAGLWQLQDHTLKMSPTQQPATTTPVEQREGKNSGKKTWFGRKSKHAAAPAAVAIPALPASMHMPLPPRPATSAGAGATAGWSAAARPARGKSSLYPPSSFLPFANSVAGSDASGKGSIKSSVREQRDRSKSNQGSVVSSTPPSSFVHFPLHDRQLQASRGILQAHDVPATVSGGSMHSRPAAMSTRTRTQSEQTLLMSVRLSPKATFAAGTGAGAPPPSSPRLQRARRRGMVLWRGIFDGSLDGVVSGSAGAGTGADGNGRICMPAQLTELTRADYMLLYSLGVFDLNDPPMLTSRSASGYNDADAGLGAGAFAHQTTMVQQSNLFKPLPGVPALMGWIEGVNLNAGAAQDCHGCEPDHDNGNDGYSDNTDDSGAETAGAVRRPSTSSALDADALSGAFDVFPQPPSRLRRFPSANRANGLTSGHTHAHATMHLPSHLCSRAHVPSSSLDDAAASSLRQQTRVSNAFAMQLLTEAARELVPPQQWASANAAHEAEDGAAALAAFEDPGASPLVAAHRRHIEAIVRLTWQGSRTGQSDAQDAQDDDVQGSRATAVWEVSTSDDSQGPTYAPRAAQMFEPIEGGLAAPFPIFERRRQAAMHSNRVLMELADATLQRQCVQPGRKAQPNFGSQAIGLSLQEELGENNARQDHDGLASSLKFVLTQLEQAVPDCHAQLCLLDEVNVVVLAQGARAAVDGVPTVRARVRSLEAHSLLNRNEGLLILNSGADFRFAAALQGDHKNDNMPVFFAALPVLSAAGMPIAFVTLSSARIMDDWSAACASLFEQCTIVIASAIEAAHRKQLAAEGERLQEEFKALQRHIIALGFKRAEDLDSSPKPAHLLRCQPSDGLAVAESLEEEAQQVLQKEVLVEILQDSLLTSRMDIEGQLLPALFNALVRHVHQGLHSSLTYLVRKSESAAAHSVDDAVSEEHQRCSIVASQGLPSRVPQDVSFDEPCHNMRVGAAPAVYSGISILPSKCACDTLPWWVFDDNRQLYKAGCMVHGGSLGPHTYTLVALFERGAHIVSASEQSYFAAAASTLSTCLMQVAELSSQSKSSISQASQHRISSKLKQSSHGLGIQA
ncbi:hypothetical protein K437DRAFT_2893 [Tilletiaria anomala UBC 951]|uniref:GAF domain-containing protein n=1 Tax=Tilletiaria anomala (strain ATCC 24038 / CBS 436.72 / UBC 951) TaxID=1037660 RepID=A0A066WRF5_TILAU|nr:uncharacterized protein K437DRAFT_2893 [Tilletiaria anomala UBC 951]KDN53589.1 hypothetical protein K437DRAFT_2893 [Tilletiaria anomala UBC 951]